MSINLLINSQKIKNNLRLNISKLEIQRNSLDQITLMSKKQQSPLNQLKKINGKTYKKELDS
jgi:hypothetical protein